jgi:hypothetical protein
MGAYMKTLNIGNLRANCGRDSRKRELAEGVDLGAPCRSCPVLWHLRGECGVMCRSRAAFQATTIRNEETVQSGKESAFQIQAIPNTAIPNQPLFLIGDE